MLYSLERVRSNAILQDNKHRLRGSQLKKAACERFVISMAILSPLFYWPEYGSMFTGPAAINVDVKGKDTTSEATTAESTPTTGNMVKVVLGTLRSVTS